MTTNLNYVSFCYVPNVDSSVRFLEHVQRYSRSFPFLVLTDGPTNSASGLSFVQLPRIGPFQNPRYSNFNKPSDRYAFWAFVNALRVARNHSVEWFTWVETDCRFGAVDWDARLFESLSYVKNPVIGGTPVCWHPWSKGPEWSMQLIKFAATYQQITGLPMAFEGAHAGSWDLAVYPNGALALYKTSELLPFFNIALAELDQPGMIDREKLAASLLAFDLYIGFRLTAKYGVELLQRFAVALDSYSGCGNHHLTEEQRVELLANGTVSSLHQIKSDRYEF